MVCKLGLTRNAVCGLQKRQCLLTIGTEEPGVTSTVLKCWQLDQLVPGRGHGAQPLKTYKLFNSKFPESDVTCLSVHESDDHSAVVAIGLASGTVLWFSGDTGEPRTITDLQVESWSVCH